MKLKEKYFAPTPAKWRKLGDAILAVSTTITTYAIADDWSKWVSITAMLMGAVGKFLTNFFTEDSAV
jgi:hypothetical protein